MANIRPDDACPVREKLPKMSMFRAKKLDLGCFVNIKVIRDHTKRKVYEKHEAERYVRPPALTKANRVRTIARLLVWGSSLSRREEWTRKGQGNARANSFPNYRQALRYIIRNTTLPPRVRAEAQLQLSQMHCYTNPTQIRNRCILGGKGRGIFSDFKMSRVSILPWIGHANPGYGAGGGH
jgi:small subunit ribosomal protein S14